MEQVRLWLLSSPVALVLHLEDPEFRPQNGTYGRQLPLLGA
jgi:hypothetical protein